MKKSILVSGASSGIGLEIVKSLARDADLLVFAGVRKATSFSEIEKIGSSNLQPVYLDVTNDDSVKEALARITRAQEAHPFSALINNAGIAVAGAMELLPLKALEEQFATNVFGTVRVTQAFLPLLRKNQGRIVNIGSISGKVALPLMGAYSGSKHALEGISDAFRRELKPWHIHVSIVEPGMIKTPIWDGSKERARELFKQASPEGQKLYRPLLESIIAKVTENLPNAALPADVVSAVEDALTSQLPKTRYLVGRDAKITNLLRKLPDRWFDALISKVGVGSQRH